MTRDPVQANVPPMPRVADGAREVQLRVTPEMAAELQRQSDIMQGAWWRASAKAARSDAALDCLERGTAILERTGAWPDDPALPASPDVERVAATEPLTLVVSERWLMWVEQLQRRRKVSRASTLRRVMLAGLIPNRRALVRREEKHAG